MKLFIHTKGLTLPNDLKELLEIRLDYALSPFEGRINQVNAFFADENATRGGRDKSLRLVVYLRHYPALFVEGRDCDLISLIDRCADRIGHSASRQADKTRAHSGQISMSGE